MVGCSRFRNSSIFDTLGILLLQLSRRAPLPCKRSGLSLSMILSRSSNTFCRRAAPPPPADKVHILRRQPTIEHHALLGRDGGSLLGPRRAWPPRVAGPPRRRPRGGAGRCPSHRPGAGDGRRSGAGAHRAAYRRSPLVLPGVSARPRPLPRSRYLRHGRFVRCGAVCDRSRMAGGGTGSRRRALFRSRPPAGAPCRTRPGDGVLSLQQRCRGNRESTVIDRPGGGRGLGPAPRERHRGGVLHL
ncbi:hypothetical protein DSECCO2_565680 [anaerobic digester metagenome]